ncbi:MAG: J domain-containing protein, partial [Anaerolineae bacterium]|nr:J domain-containing protein [Anaerolineae bacterium]
YETLYGPQVHMERLHYGRMAVRLRAMKGYWLTAHFGSTAFWQQERRQFYMPPPRRPAEGTGTNGRTNAGTAGLPRSEKTRLEHSYDVLGVHQDATQDEVKTAFRRQVFNVHPDVSALPKFMAEEKFRILAEAYEYIKIERGWS